MKQILAIMELIYKQDIQNSHELSEFIKNQPFVAELRVPVKTSFGKDYSIPMFFLDRKNNRTVLVPYYYEKQQKMRKEGIENREQEAIPEDPLNTLYRGAPLETGLSVVSYDTLGRPIKRRNSYPGAFVPHLQYPYVIPEFSGGLLDEDRELFSEKHGLPVWVANHLLKDIFNPSVMNDGSVRYHPQRKLFERYEKYLHSEPFISFDDDEYDEW